MANTFLQAEWRKLVMANYAVDPKLLQPYLPYKTEFDLWQNTCYVSLIGFMFMNTKVKGFKIPFHINFEEVNLRFYVRYNDQGTWKRGTVFIKEIVSKPALAWVANTVYKEKYVTMPTKHSWALTEEDLTVAYLWKKKNWHSIKIVTGTTPQPIAEGSEAEFITEHYWGYTKIGSQKTAEYGVEHPRWEMYTTKDYAIQVDFGAVYGPQFALLDTLRPESVFLAEGSEIEVKTGRNI